MKFFLIIFISATVIYSCSSNNFCKSTKNYLKTGIDTNRPFKVKGTYCIASSSDILLRDDSSILVFDVYDRTNGKRLENGIIYFYGYDTTSLVFNNSITQKTLKAGNYIIEVWEAGYHETKTKRVDLKPNTNTSIVFYLGTTLDF